MEGEGRIACHPAATHRESEVVAILLSMLFSQETVMPPTMWRGVDDTGSACCSRLSCHPLCGEVLIRAQCVVPGCHVPEECSVYHKACPARPSQVQGAFHSRLHVGRAAHTHAHAHTCTHAHTHACVHLDTGMHLDTCTHTQYMLLAEIRTVD